jgi:hypothetical protein
MLATIQARTFCLQSKDIQIGIYRTIILPVVLYGCETWSLALQEEHRLMVFETRVLRRICGPKRVEALGNCRKLHNEELYNLYSPPSIIRMIKSLRMRWAGHVARMGAKRVSDICITLGWLNVNLYNKL